TCRHRMVHNQSVKDALMTSETVPLYDIFEGRTGRPEGMYLQDEERRQAEITRARREGREPNFDTKAPYVGDVLVTEHALPGSGEVKVDPIAEVPVDTDNLGDAHVGDPVGDTGNEPDETGPDPDRDETPENPVVGDNPDENEDGDIEPEPQPGDGESQGPDEEDPFA